MSGDVLMSGPSDPDLPDLADPDHMLRTRGVTLHTDGFVVGSVFSRDGSLAAFATGEGELHLAPRPANGSTAAWQRVAVHDGAILSLAADVGSSGFLTGGDDSTLRRTDGASGVIDTIAKGRRWVEQVSSFADPRAKRGESRGLIASSSGKQVELRDAAGTLLKTLEHETTVSGLAFDAKGKRIAASHYNGASLWFTNAVAGTPRLLSWKGSHIGVALHPDGEALVTAMQENELHGWRLPDGHNMRMSGYPQKTQSFSFSRNGKWLATSGAEVVVLWPFFGGGPMGKAPTELAGVPNSICTRVAFHPQHDIVAGGFADGTVLMSDVATRRVLPVCGTSGGAVTSLCFNATGDLLAFGTETGRMALVDLAAR